MNLREKAKQLQNSLPFMEGREKGDMQRIVNMNAIIRDYGFMEDDKNKEYVAFIIDEDSEHFYFGGQVLTDNMHELEADGYHDEIVKEGLPVFFDKKKSKNGRDYVTVKFYPDEK
jgi:hypothetical protein